MAYLDFIEKIVGILSGSSIIFVACSYFYTKKQDKINYITDQISFFRKEILPISYSIIDSLQLANKKIELCNISLENPDIEFIKKNYLKNVEIQIEQLKNNETIYRLKTGLLDAMEEFSLRVINSKTINHEALNSIKPAFVLLVENNAVLLLHHRLISTGNSIYSGVLTLYSSWVNKVDRTSPKDRIEKMNKELIKK